MSEPSCRRLSVASTAKGGGCHGNRSHSVHRAGPLSRKATLVVQPLLLQCCNFKGRAIARKRCRQAGDCWAGLRVIHQGWLNHEELIIYVSDKSMMGFGRAVWRSRLRLERRDLSNRVHLLREGDLNPLTLEGHPDCLVHLTHDAEIVKRV